MCRCIVLVANEGEPPHVIPHIRTTSEVRVDEIDEVAVKRRRIAPQVSEPFDELGMRDRLRRREQDLEDGNA
jgi:hypothetical protein